MCGRFTQTQSAEAIAAAFQLTEVSLLEPRYNIAPSQSIPTILLTAEQPDRQLKLLRWGLIPSWSKDPQIGARMINARAETLTEKPAFRSAFKKRRCLVVADGFYEWKRQGKNKQPFYFQLQDQQPFGFAGLWEHWQAPTGEAIASCTILTTEPNELLGSIHNRMPVILHPADYDLWLDPEVQQTELLQPLLRPYKTEAMVAHPVSTEVNNPQNDSPECIQDVAA